MATVATVLQANGVAIPGDAVTTDGVDIAQPAVLLLKDLNLLPSSADLETSGKWTAGLQGPPQSVALIEANATALSKWWAAGLGAAVLTAWGAVQGFWADNSPANQRALALAAAIVSAAALVAIGYLLAADIRGRAMAQVATIDARARLSEAMLTASKRAFLPPPSPDNAAAIVALPAAMAATWVTKEDPEDKGWHAIALKVDGNGSSYMMVKGLSQGWADAKEVKF